MNMLSRSYTILLHIAAECCCCKNININHPGVIETNVREAATRAEGKGYS
jgi:hypothetical protein